MRGAAADLLTPTGAVIAVTASAAQAEERLVTLGASELYALSADGQLLGIVPDYELLKRRLAGDQRPQCVADLMSPVGVSITCATSLSDVAIHMRSGCYRQLPVVANGRLVGEVTRRNLLRYFRRSERAPDFEQNVDATDRSDAAEGATGGPKFLRTGRLPTTM